MSGRSWTAWDHLRDRRSAQASAGHDRALGVGRTDRRWHAVRVRRRSRRCFHRQARQIRRCESDRAAHERKTVMSKKKPQRVAPGATRDKFKAKAYARELKM